MGVALLDARKRQSRDSLGHEDDLLVPQCHAVILTQESLRCRCSIASVEVKCAIAIIALALLQFSLTSRFSHAVVDSFLVVVRTPVWRRVTFPVAGIVQVWESTLRGTTVGFRMKVRLVDTSAAGAGRTV